MEKCWHSQFVTVAKTEYTVLRNKEPVFFVIGKIN